MINRKTAETDITSASEKSERRIKIIAEIGTSHNGNLARAEELISAAADAGADCVKTQIVFADEIIHPETGNVELPGGSISLYKRFSQLERGFDFYLALKELTKKKGLEFTASPFGLKSLAWLLKLDTGIIKIASPELNHFPLLKQAAASGKKLLLSTGVSLLKDIDAAVNITGPEKTALLHCITAYPAPEDEYNLLLIPFLAKHFNTEAGVSDHSSSPEPVPAAAAVVGALYIEKHITLGHEDGGLDDPIALTPADFSIMTASIRDVERVPDGERIEYIRSRYGEERIEKILGNGVKKPAPSERINYGRTNRSVHALCDLPEGSILTADNTALLRSEKKLRPGIRPEFYDEILGMKLVNDVESGQGIRAVDLGLNRDDMEFPL